jgi:UDP-glucose 4-epimerase
VARANVLAAEAPVTGEVFNIASGTETSLRDLADALQRVMGSTADLEFGPARTVNAVTRRLADTSKAAELIGFRAEVSLDEGLRRLVQWWSAERGAMAVGV